MAVLGTAATTHPKWRKEQASNGNDDYCENVMIALWDFFFTQCSLLSPCTREASYRCLFSIYGSSSSSPSQTRKGEEICKERPSLPLSQFEYTLRTNCVYICCLISNKNASKQSAGDNRVTMLKFLLKKSAKLSLEFKIARYWQTQNNARSAHSFWIFRRQNLGRPLTMCVRLKAGKNGHAEVWMNPWG